MFKASAVTLTPPPPPPSGKEEVEFSHLGQSDEKDNNMDNKLYDLGAAMAHEASMVMSITSDCGHKAVDGVTKECKTSGSSYCTACKEQCGHIMIKNMNRHTYIGYIRCRV